MLRVPTLMFALYPQRDAERKSKVTGFVELQGAADKAAAAAAIARQQYRERLRENRIKIAEKLKDRPSLIERHEQVCFIYYRNAHVCILYAFMYIGYEKTCSRYCSIGYNGQCSRKFEKRIVF